MNPLLSDPLFFATAIPAVILVGLSKGGLGGAMALIGVPLMTLAVPPVQAAAIMLPILVVMDIAGLWTWRGHHDARTLRYMLPGALFGIAIGWATAALVTAAMVKLIVGATAFIFALRWFGQRLSKREEKAARHTIVRASIWSTLAGFTSFVAHAGGPPYQVYALPLKQSPQLYTGTSVVFFAVVNAVKLVPYFALGELGTANLTASAVLMPLAAVATIAGAWIVKRMNAAVFYPLMYVMILIVSAKLIWDGLFDILR